MSGADKGHAAIDRVYDAAERGVAGLAAVMGVDTRDEAPKSSAPAAPDRTIAAPARLALAEASTSNAPTTSTPAKFRIAKAIDVATKAPSFVITDGTTMYTTASEAFANAVLAELAKSGAA